MLQRAVVKDAAGSRIYTQWELSTLAHMGVLGKIDFYYGGKLIENPFS